MSLLVDLQVVPDRILETVKARILANRARLQQQAELKGPTRPRVQRARFNASATTYRRPEPSAQGGDVPSCVWFFQDQRYSQLSPGYFSDNAGPGNLLISQVANPGWAVTPATRPNLSPILTASATVIARLPENYQTGDLFSTRATMTVGYTSAAFVRVKFTYSGPGLAFAAYVVLPDDGLFARDSGFSNIPLAPIQSLIQPGPPTYTFKCPTNRKNFAISAILDPQVIHGLDDPSDANNTHTLTIQFAAATSLSQLPTF